VKANVSREALEKSAVRTVSEPKLMGVEVARGVAKAVCAPQTNIDAHRKDSRGRLGLRMLQPYRGSVTDKRIEDGNPVKVL
jgi:hypothetical protein